MLELRPVGDGGHAAISVGTDERTVGRGETTNVWEPVVSRAHCALRGTREGVVVTAKSRNYMVVLPGGRAEKAFRIAQGESAVANPGDRLALVVTGQFLYEVHGRLDGLDCDTIVLRNDSDAGALAAAAAEPLSPVREDTDDEAEGGMGVVVALSEAASPAEKANYSFERIQSVMPAGDDGDDDDDDDDDFFPPPPAGTKGKMPPPPRTTPAAASSTARVLNDLFDDDDEADTAATPVVPPIPVANAVVAGGAGRKRAADEVEDSDNGDVAPPAKQAKLTPSRPACKYGASCTRKNPQHFVDFEHPFGVGPAAAAAAAPQPQQQQQPRPPCKYGAGCTRKNPAHFVEFAHPQGVPLPAGCGHAKDVGGPMGDGGGGGSSSLLAGKLPAAVQPAAAPPGAGVDLNGIDVMDLALRETRKEKGVVPDRFMPPDELVMVSTITGGSETYKMKYTAGGYYCTCVAWKFQNRSVNERTCKHLAMYLGAAYEQARCNLGGAGAVVPVLTAKFDHKGVLLAEKWDEKRSLVGWYLSEKLDGVRALWDGTRFLSRLKNQFHVPKRFTEGFPKDVVLDGELFCGRGLFQKTVGIVKSGETHTGWDTVRFHVFDVPSLEKPFEERLAYLMDTIDACNPYVVVVPHIKAQSAAHVTKELDAVMKLNGEGLMARQPGSKYAHTRSSTLLKIKKFLDCDAKIIGYEQGKGKHSDKVGSLFCTLADGTKFSVGTGLSDAQRRNPPKVGAVISVKYQNLTDGGVPRFPVYLGVRADAQWPPQA